MLERCITIFGNRRRFHDFETIQGRGFSNREQEKHQKHILCDLMKCFA